jgi:hypothetical protein
MATDVDVDVATDMDVDMAIDMDVDMYVKVVDEVDANSPCFYDQYQVAQIFSAY